MAILTSAFIGAMIGTDKRDAVSPSDVIATHIAQADSRVVAAAAKAGYSVDSSLTYTGDTLQTLQSMAMRAYLSFAYPLRREAMIPTETLDSFIKLEDVESGAVPIPGLTASQLGGAGGADFVTWGTANATNDVPVFTLSKLTGFR